MIWKAKTPHRGDMIRTKVKFYYHYGIFVDENCIVQFGLPDNSGLDPELIEVCVTDIEVFLNGSALEVAELSLSEKAKRKSRDKTVETALSQVGKRGYNILHNNCEHFANGCLFGESRSAFLEDVRKEINKKLKK